MLSSDAASFYGFSVGSSPWNRERPHHIDISRGGVPTAGSGGPRSFMTAPVFRDPPPMLPPNVLNRMSAEQRGQFTPTIVPPQFWGKQEYRYMHDKPQAVRAPEKFVEGKGTSDRDRKGQFYSTATGQSAGMFLGEGGYGGFGRGKQPPRSDLGQGRSPLAFTGFGQLAGNQKADQYQTPIGRGLSSMNTLGIPSFPFAGAESAFERSARNATTFGGMQMFPYAGY